jgi:hypothetical protein
MTCHFCAQQPPLLSCFNKIIPQTASQLSNAYIDTQYHKAMWTRIYTFFISVTSSFWLICVVCIHVGGEFLLIQHFLSELHCILFCLVNWGMVKAFASTLMLRQLTRELPRDIEESTNTTQFRIFSNAASLRTGSTDATFHVNVTNSMSKNAQCMAICYPLLYMILREWNLWRRCSHSGVVGAVSLGGDCRRFEAMHYRYSHESSRGRILHSFIPNFIRNFAKHSRNYAAESSWINFVVIHFLTFCVL